MMSKKSPALGLLLLLSLSIFAGGGCSKQSQFERRLANGDKQKAAGHYDIAEAEYKAALQLVPGEPIVMARIARMLLDQGRVVTSYLLLQDVLKQLPEDPDVQITYGLTSLAMTRTTDARNAAKKAIEQRPGNEEAVLLLVETCITTRDSEETRRIVTQLQEKNGKAAVYHVALGMLNFAQRDQAGAEAEFRKAIELDPKSSAAYAQMGNLQLSRGEQPQAAASLKTAAELSPARAPRRLKYIDFLIRTGSLSEAKTELDKLIATAPDYVPALGMAMKLAFAQGNAEEADQLASKVLAIDRTNYDAILQRAAIRLQKNDIPGVIAELNALENYYPRAPQIKYQLALAYLKKGEPYVAEEHLQKALSISPDYDEGIILLADLRIKKGDYLAATSVLPRLIERNPRAVQAYVLLAQAYQAVGNWSESIRVLQRLVEITPKSPESAYLLGATLQLAGRKDEARTALEQAVQLSDVYWPALEMLVVDDLARGQKSAALSRAEKLIASHPQIAGPWLFRAKIRLADGDGKGAEADLLKAIEAEPAAQYPYAQLSRLYFLTNRGQEAVAQLSAAATKSNLPSSYTQLGALYNSLKQYDLARDAYEKALARDARFLPALNNLAALYAHQLGQVEKGFTLARQARDLAPTDPMIADTLGWVYFRRGQFEVALPLVQAGVQAFPGDQDILYHLAMVYYQLGQEEPARQAFQRVIALAGDSPVKTDSRSRLEVLALDPATVTASARPSLETRLQADPTDLGVLLRLAAIKERSGAPRDAALHYEAALKLTPRSFSTLLSLINLYVGPLNDHARARELAKQAHNLQPSDGQAAWRFGRLIYDTEDYAWAASLLQEAVRQLPNQPDVLFDLARAQYAVGRIPEAETALKQALADQKLSGRDAAQRMATLIAAKTPALVQAALPEARKVLATEPANIPALMVAAQAAEQQKDYQGARQTYDKVLAANSSFAPAQRRLAILYAEQLGDDQKAEEFANRARQVFNDDPELAYALGTINYRKGDYNAAQRFLRQSLAKRENHAETLFFLGMAQYQLKNLPESRTQLQKALQNNLPEQESHEARRVLQELNRGRSQG